jgi:transcription initiation factor TFIID subunit 5
MLRMESANQEIDGRPLPPLGEDARPKYRMGFDILKVWVEDNLDLYKVGYFLIINMRNAYLWTART